MIARDRYNALFARGDSTDRIEFFSDAVFAIAMTLLVLDIRVPDIKGRDLNGALHDLLPQMFAYALSFLVISLNWIAHHRKFRVIIGFDNTLTRLNLLLLFLIAFLPFPTSVLSNYASQPAAVILYAATSAAIAGSQVLILWHARRANLLDKSVDTGVYRLMMYDGVVSPFVFTISIGIAFISTDAAMYSWIAMAPLSRFASWWAGRRDTVATA
ncbi:MAG: hypothetical protein JWQ70_351 [Aeromicrobium sp.]|nr:hypothetical protein [Aeromicrobium sp.]